MNSLFSKMKGGAESPPRPGFRHIAISWLGGFLAISVVAYLANISNVPLILGSFGATCVLVFGFP